MKDYESKIMADRKDLGLKLKVLIDFMHTDSYAAMAPVDQGLVMVQQVAMNGLMEALDRRIERFREHSL